MTSGVRTSNRQIFPQSCDVLVVGGGPAGLAAGIALRQRGLDVVVADALLPPIDKACGEGLMPDSRRELAALGVELNSGREFSGIHFANRTRGREDLVTAEFPIGRGIGIRRVDLHRCLISRAEELGVRLQWGSRVDLSGPQVTVGGEVYAYRYLVGADGERSRVRRWAGLESGLLWSERLAFRRHYQIAPWSDHVEVHWCDAGQAYVTPVAENEVCVAAVTRQWALNFDRVLKGLPYLETKLRGLPAVGRDRGSVTITRKLKRVARENIALIGDASGSADAITGQGLASAFREARLLADALSRDCIADYEAGHGNILRLPQTTATAMLLMDRWPRLRNRVMRVFAGRPDLFAKLLTMHSREERPSRLDIAPTAPVGFRRLIAGIRLGIHDGSRRKPASHMLASVTAQGGEFASSEADLFESCREIA